MTVAEHEVSRVNGNRHHGGEEDFFSPEEKVTSTAIESITRGELDTQIRTARAYPRSITKFLRDALSMAITNVETAKSCMYAVNRGGKMLKGPSVRLAEICAAAYGHLRIAARHIDDDGKFVTCQGVCWDLENNVAISTEVKRRVTGKEGRRYTDDMIGVTINAANSIALRNSILKVIPRAYIDQVYNQAVKVAVGDSRTLDVRRDACVHDLRKLGITDERFLAVVEKKAVGDIGLDELATLIALFNRVKEDEEDIDTVFPPLSAPAEKPADKASKADKINDKLRGESNRETAAATPPASDSAKDTAAAPAEPGGPPSWAELEKAGIAAVIEDAGIAVQLVDGEKCQTLRPDGTFDAGYNAWTVQPNNPAQDKLAREMAAKALAKAPAPAPVAEAKDAPARPSRPRNTPPKG